MAKQLSLEKNLILVTLFLCLYISIWILTPRWFPNILIWTIDFLIGLVTLLNILVLFFYRNRGIRRFSIAANLFKIHTLGLLLLLLGFITDDCTAYLSTRIGFFMKHYFNLDIVTHEIGFAKWIFLGLVIICIIMVFLEIRLIKSVKRIY